MNDEKETRKIIEKECEFRKNECEECPFYELIDGEYYDCALNYLD